MFQSTVNGWQEPGDLEAITGNDCGSTCQRVRTSIRSPPTWREN